MEEKRPRRRWPAALGGMVLGLTLAGTTAFAATSGSGPFDYLDLNSPNGTTQRVTVTDDGKLVVTPQKTTEPTTPPVTTTPPATSGPATTYDDKDSAFTFSSGWTTCGGCGGTSPLGGSYKYANDAGSSYTLRFSGTSVVLFGMKERPGGTATVTIDGKSAGSINHYAATQSGPVEVFRSDGLDGGAHVLVVTATGQGGNSASLGSAVTIDRAVVNGAAPTTTAPTSTAPTTTAPTSTAPTTSVPTTTPPVTTPPASGAAVALKRVGNQLQYATGGEAWLVGYNSFTMGGGCGSAAELAAASQANSKAFIDTMRHDGHGVLRLFYWSGYSAQVKANLAELVNYAASKNVYVVLTLSDGQKGCGNAGPTTLDANSYAHVKEAATRFKGNPGVAFFEVANEPTSSDWSAGFLNRVRGTYDTIKGIDSTRLVGSGTQASYFLGGTDRQAQVNAIVDVTSMHDYEGGCDASRTKQELSLSQGKPMVMGEFGTLDSGSFNSRNGIFACKLATWAGYDGFAGAFGWAWQPGNGGSASEYGNLDADSKTQNVLRTATLG